MALIAGWPAPDGVVLTAFWILLVLSSVSSHAPKRLRHWRRGDR